MSDGYYIANFGFYNCRLFNDGSCGKDGYLWLVDDGGVEQSAPTTGVGQCERATGQFIGTHLVGPRAIGEIRNFARQARDDLWLTGFQISQGGEAIEIRGRLFEPSRLADYVQRLNGVAVFQGRRFAALDMQHVTPDEKPGESTAKAEKAAASSDTARPVVEFTLRSQLDHEGKEALTGKGMP